MRILLAEDDPVSAKVVESILIKNNFEVKIVCSGREAIDILKLGESFDAIISDIKMPDVDGIGLLKYIRGSLRYKRIPVILTTGLNDHRTINIAMQHGLSGYIVKPIEASILMNKLQIAFENSIGAILVVDDELLLCTLLKNVLEREGYRVLTAPDGIDALKVLEEKKISIIISDIKMPQMSGTELLVEVKENFPDIPIILMTGYDLDFTKEDAISSGADDYITKPFKNVEIIHIIRTCLTRNKRKMVNSQ